MNAEPAKVLVLCMLAANGVCDIRKKEILLLPTVVFAAAGIIFDAAAGMSAAKVLCGLLPGALLAALSAASCQAVGAGDAILLASVGIWTGCGTAFLTLAAAFWIQAAVSVIYGLTGGRKKELPFVPAILAAYALLIVLTAL